MSSPVHGGALRLDELLSRAAATDPQREAVIFGDVSWTYARVGDRARRLAASLAALGVERGDRVALWASNRAEFAEILFGIPLLGAIAVPLDQWWTHKDAMAAISQVRPKVLIVGTAQAGLLEGCGSDLDAAGVAHVVSLDAPAATAPLPYERLLADAQPLHHSVPVASDDPALILFTSGSTGRSKGAVHTHRSLIATAMVMSLELGLRDGERTLHFLPLFSSCLEHLIPLTLMRATHVIMPQFDAAQVWQAIATHRITHIDAVPTTLRRMLEAAPSTIPLSLRLVSYASEPMPGPLISALAEKMPQVDFVQFYGMIEHLCLTVQRPPEQIEKKGSVGLPMVGAELRLLETDDGPAGPVGEILARSPSMFAGYWQDPEATAKVMHDGWMRTGDLGAFDEDGFLVLSGRLKEVIKTGGVSVIPGEVEATLLRHPHVREAAVVGIPDENWGEAVHAFVTLHAGAGALEDDLKTFCRGQLAGYKSPKAVHVVEELPRTGIGKIARRAVREDFLRARTEEVIP